MIFWLALDLDIKKNLFIKKIICITVNYDNVDKLSLYYPYFRRCRSYKDILKNLFIAILILVAVDCDFEFEVLCKFAKQGYQVTEFPIEYYLDHLNKEKN